MAAVLLVDDDVELAEMLGDYLAQDGFLVTTVHDGVSGVEAALSGNFAIAVLDVMMPGLSGIEVLRRIRADSRPLPGTRLIREWQGVQHVVTVRQHDFEFEGRPYQSLSAIARHITGTRWNGWTFFGLKGRAGA